MPVIYLVYCRRPRFSDELCDGRIVVMAMNCHIHTRRFQFGVYLLCYELFMELCDRIIIFCYYFDGRINSSFAVSVWSSYATDA